MKKYAKLLIIILILVTSPVMGQSHASISVEETYDELTGEWLAFSDELQYYGSLGEFCDNASYRNKILETLRGIHHYDSLILDIINDPMNELDLSHHTYKQTLQDLQELETEYSVKAFISKLKESCITRNSLESEKEDLRKNSGVYSYDGQVLLLETELGKFLKHLDKKIVNMQDHIHKIHPDQISNLPGLVQSE